MRFLNAQNRPLDPDRDALGVSRAVTNDATLPRRPAPDGTSPDPENFRIEVRDGTQREGTVELHSVNPGTGEARAVLEEVPLVATGDGMLRSPWLRLVGDDIDARAPGVEHRVLRVALRDEVRARYEPASGPAREASMPVGRPGAEGGQRAALRGRLRVRVLRLWPDGPPVVGADDAEARRIARRQVDIANEIWLQCFIGFGPPEEADVEVVDPPPPALVSVGDGDGLPAAGDGKIRLRVDGRPVGPVRTRAGDPPVVTALRVADALRQRGMDARVTENLATEAGAGRSADVLVRRKDGRLAALAPDGSHALGTDSRQSVQIGEVDLVDGLREFRNTDAGTGTLEERTLLKALMDDDPRTIDVFVVSGFSSGTRQGEAFIEHSGGAVVGAVLLDRNGLRHQRAAWTQAHELGHVLLDDPYHPDNVGPDRPWLLMDADTSLPRVTGPKRLTPRECRRARRRSGPDAIPALLVPDPR
ncbi:MAG: hypothetical protein ACOC97_00975 [Myxococcota bacterium]